MRVLLEVPTCHRRPILLAMASMLLLAASASKAEERARSGGLKPAWEWTVDERLAKRFDPEAIKARAARLAAQEKAFSSRFPEAADDSAMWKSAPGVVTDSIEGDREPELFLPFELFDHLINMGLASGSSQESRAIIEEKAAALGFGRDLWPRLAKAAAPYLQLQRDDERRAREQPEPSRSIDSLKMDRDGIHYCRVRAQALAAAKVEFGAEPFLRFLYLGTTRGHSRGNVVKAGMAEFLRYLEGGCK